MELIAAKAAADSGIDPAWAVVVGVVVSGLFGLAIAWGQHVWTARNLRQSQIEETGRQAAKNLLSVLDEVRRLYEGVLAFATDDVPDERRYELCYRMKRELIMLHDDSFQERFEEIHTSLWYIERVTEQTGQYLQQVAHILYRAGEELVGAYSTGKPVPAESSFLVSSVRAYYVAAKEWEGQMERNFGEQERKQPRRRDGQAG